MEFLEFSLPLFFLPWACNSPIIALDGEISQGRILSNSSEKKQIISQIKRQLQYPIGQFNGQNGSPDSSRTKISIQNIENLENGLFDVSYRAQLSISWPRERTVPETFELIVPASGVSAGLNRFFQTYGSQTSKCLDQGAHDVSVNIFWYYCRPNSSQCVLSEGMDHSQEDPTIVSRFPVELKVSNENTQDKSPEYSKIWEDGKLVVTSMFGKNEATGGVFDAGTRAYRQMYQWLVRSYG